MGTARHFTTATLGMFAGPIIWGAHFLLVYAFTALAYARRFSQSEWLGVSVLVWSVGAATALAVAGILAALYAPWRKLRTDRPEGTESFLSWMTLAFGILSVLAVIWVALPVLILPAGLSLPVEH